MARINLEEGAEMREHPTGRAEWSRRIDIQGYSDVI